MLIRENELGPREPPREGLFLPRPGALETGDEAVAGRLANRV
jgi:hypothetical protein